VNRTTLDPGTLPASPERATFARGWFAAVRGNATSGAARGQVAVGGAPRPLGRPGLDDRRDEAGAPCLRECQALYSEANMHTLKTLATGQDGTQGAPGPSRTQPAPRSPLRRIPHRIGRLESAIHRRVEAVRRPLGPAARAGSSAASTRRWIAVGSWWVDVVTRGVGRCGKWVDGSGQEWIEARVGEVIVGRTG